MAISPGDKILFRDRIREVVCLGKDSYEAYFLVEYENGWQEPDHTRIYKLSANKKYYWLSLNRSGVDYLTAEDILAKYPSGTIYRPVHIAISDPNSRQIIPHNPQVVFHSNYVEIKPADTSHYVHCVWENGKWAEIFGEASGVKLDTNNIKSGDYLISENGGYLFKVTSNPTSNILCGPTICISAKGEAHCYLNGGGHYRDKVVRKATKEESDWLEACITANKLVPKVKVEPKVTTAMKFKLGDVVKFRTNTERIPNFRSEEAEIPSHLIKHGSVYFKENKGTVVNSYKDYYIVEYIGSNNELVRLGFTEDVLELLSDQYKAGDFVYVKWSNGDHYVMRLKASKVYDRWMTSRSFGASSDTIPSTSTILRYATQEEREHLQACIDAKMFVSPEDVYKKREVPPKYEVGDTVVCIEIPKEYQYLKNEDCEGKGYGWESGKVFTIHEVDKGSKNPILWSSGTLKGGVYSIAVKKHTDASVSISVPTEEEIITRYPVGAIVNSLVPGYLNCTVTNNTDMVMHFEKEHWVLGQSERGTLINILVWRAPNEWASVVKMPGKMPETTTTNVGSLEILTSGRFESGITQNNTGKRIEFTPAVPLRTVSKPKITRVLVSRV